MCDSDLENLNHFILWCTGYSEIRNSEPLLQQPYIQDEELILGRLLFANAENFKETLYKFWKIRERKRTTQ